MTESIGEHHEFNTLPLINGLEGQPPNLDQIGVVQPDQIDFSRNKRPHLAEQDERDMDHLADTAMEMAAQPDLTNVTCHQMVVTAPLQDPANLLQSDDPPRPVPFHVGRGSQGFTVHSLGTIVWDRPAFHSKLYIYPVGFKSSRLKPSYVNPSGPRVIYTSEIFDGGDAPIFRVTAADDPGNPIEARFPTTAWTQMVHRIFAARSQKPAEGQEKMTTVSGQDMFGLSDKRVALEISRLPNAHHCFGSDAVQHRDPHLDGSAASVQLPLHIGRGSQGFTVVALGVVQWNRPQFRTKLHIYPVGYKSTRLKPSYINPNGPRVLYTSEILDGGDAPIFRVTASDDPDHPIEARFPSGAWTAVAHRLAQARVATGKKTASTISGQDMFGLSDKRVALLISQLPNAQRPCPPEQVHSPEQPLATWLRANDLSQYQHLFVQHNVDVAFLPRLTDKHLIQMGVHSVGDRAEILSAINDMRKGASSPRKRTHQMMQSSAAFHSQQLLQQQQQQQHYAVSLQQLQQQQQQHYVQQQLQHQLHQQHMQQFHPHALLQQQLVPVMPQMMQLQLVGDAMSTMSDQLQQPSIETQMTAQQLQQAMALQQQAMTANLLLQAPSSPSNINL